MCLNWIWPSLRSSSHSHGLLSPRTLQGVARTIMTWMCIFIEINTSCVILANMSLFSVFLIVLEVIWLQYRISGRNSPGIQTSWNLSHPFQLSNCFENLHRTRQWYYRVPYKVSKHFDNLTIRCEQARFREIWVKDACRLFYITTDPWVVVGCWWEWRSFAKYCWLAALNEVRFGSQDRTDI